MARTSVLTEAAGTPRPSEALIAVAFEVDVKSPGVANRCVQAYRQVSAASIAASASVSPLPYTGVAVRVRERHRGQRVRRLALVREGEAVGDIQRRRTRRRFGDDGEAELRRGDLHG